MIINEKKVNIEVDETDVVLVISEDLETQLFFNKSVVNDPDSVVSDNIAIMTAINTRLTHDPTFVDNLMNWLDELETLESLEPPENCIWN